jgi:hypothetical protein
MEKRKNDEYPSSNNNKKTKEDTIYKTKMPSLSFFENDRLKYLINSNNVVSDPPTYLSPGKLIEIPLRMDLITKPTQSFEDYIIDDILWEIFSYFDSFQYIYIGQFEIFCSVCKRWDKIIRSKNIYEKYYLDMIKTWICHTDGYFEIPKGSLISCISCLKKDDSKIFFELICKRILYFKDNMLCKVLNHMPKFMLNDNSEILHQQNTNFKINDLYQQKAFNTITYHNRSAPYFKAFEFIELCMIYLETPWNILFEYTNFDSNKYNTETISSIQSSVVEQCISSRRFRRCCLPAMEIEKYDYKKIKLYFFDTSMIGKMFEYTDWPENNRFLKDILKIASFNGKVKNGNIIFKFLKNGNYDFEKITFNNQSLIEFIITNPNTTVATTQKICKYFKGKYDHLIDTKGSQLKILTMAKNKKKITKEQFFSIAFQDSKTRSVWNLFPDKEKTEMFPKWKEYERETQ